MATWIGAINDDAGNPGNWDTDTAPQPGDTLFATGPATIDITDNALAGDQLNLLGSVGLNLSNNAEANLVVRASSPFSGRPPGDVIANLTGNNTLNAVVEGDPRTLPGKLSVTLLTPNTNLHGSFFLSLAASLTISGSQDAQYVHNGTDTILSSAKESVDTKVVGSGTFLLQGSFQFGGAQLQFGGFVAEEQSVDFNGSAAGGSLLTVSDPSDFHATVDFHQNGQVDLVGLAQADSWNYTNDLLTIRGPRGNAIDTLHVLNEAPSTGGGLAVSKVGDDVFLSPGNSSSGSFNNT
jgi:hypothetical protein